MINDYQIIITTVKLRPQKFNSVTSTYTMSCL